MASQTILVTGGAGYIGSHTCKALAQAGYTPVVYDNLCSGNREAVQWGPFEQGDIRDRARLKAVIEQYKPAAIMHFAALIQVGQSVTDPALYYDNNVYGSLCLLEEARAAGIHHFVLSSTAAVYGMPKSVPVKEDDALLPINPYGQSKLAMENMVRDFSAAYGLRYAVLRYFNAAGADPQTQTGSAYKVDTHIIPLLMKVASGMMPAIKLFGEDYDTEDGTAVRDYVHVSDLAQAHILSLEHILKGNDNLTINIGNSTGFSVAQVIDAAKKVTGQTIAIEKSPRRAGDPAVLVADSARAKNALGWSAPLSDLETIIETAWAWRQKQNKG